MGRSRQDKVFKLMYYICHMNVMTFMSLLSRGIPLSLGIMNDRKVDHQLGGPYE